ncbi:uncharacterized protein EV422DRAFT_557304 [Fimicolochytrium jonesii]|uniref:uncharacterized protein n=1 Tax=Fimicolochytrium jonesii TaxID=1396493 RepID=UPI0022FDB2DC|nr:uncharacterized protein EV422DRAFT_557304 [Fimicolochytrium jonesii]KAI8820649.1 hypothetical protein EV422DRAFT_557304 [Fimicolochytrium jonesii]
MPPVATAPYLTTASPRKSARKQASSDLLPGFEQKFGGPAVNGGKAPSFALQDGLAFMSYAGQAIAQDEFSKCFKQGPRRSFSPKTILLGPLYWLGWVLRYFVLFPYRLGLLLVATVLFFIALPVVLRLKSEEWQRWLFRSYCKAFLMSWGSRVRYHGKKPKLSQPHIFVSNHTSVIDYLVLSANDFPHATVAQTHGGIIGYFEHSVLTLNGSLMFNRNEKNDRTVLAQKMRLHVSNPNNVPLLIFPEGTCVNNEYTVLFHKGAFDLDAVVAPVAIKYNKRWADAYWHSKTQTFTKHLLYLMTRWALVADVHYLPPRSRKPGQSAVEFANEVKADISTVAKLKNLSWDGYFKNFAPAKDKQVRLQEHPQTRYGAVLLNRMRNRPARDRLGGLRRSASVSLDSQEAQRIARDAMSSQQPEWETKDASTTARNEILVALEQDERPSDMIQEICHKKNDVVSTWKYYSKMRSSDFIQRRVENSSWRLWFKHRIQQEQQRAAEREAAISAYEDEYVETPPPRVRSAYNLASLLRPALYSPAITEATQRPRSRSLGTKPFKKPVRRTVPGPERLAQEAGAEWGIGNYIPMVPAR